MYVKRSKKRAGSKEKKAGPRARQATLKSFQRLFM
jgi:hypothetical protein